MPRHDTTVLRYEAWTLPWSGDFHRVVASIPVVEGSGKGSIHFREVAGEGSMDIDLSNFDRLDDIVSDDTGTLIRVFDGTTIIHEWLAERVSRINDDNNRIASVSGPSLQSAFDKWVVYPFDYPALPTKQPDWVYGGRNILGNPGFEDPTEVTEIWTLLVDATGGTFTLSDGTNTTDPIPYNVGSRTLEQFIETGITAIEDVLVRPLTGVAQAYDLSIDATGGTFVLSGPSNNTGPLAHNISAGNLKTAVEGLTGVTTVTINTLPDGEGYEIFFVTPASFNLSINNSNLTGGSATLSVSLAGGGWEIEFVRPPMGISLSLNAAGLTGVGSLDLTREGAFLAPPWMKSQMISVGVPREFGVYDAFEPSQNQVHTGDWSLFIDPGPVTSRIAAFAGAQQVLSVNTGALHQASIWVRPTAAGQTYRLVIRGVNEELIAHRNVSPPANTWTQVVLSDFTIPPGHDQIIYRFANTQLSGNPAGFYIDDAVLIEGMAPSTLGVIVSDLMNDATLDHAGDPRGVVLDWVDYSSFDFDDDSSSDPWDQEISANIPFGFTYGQAWDSFTDLGYEWELVPKASPTATLTHDLHWYNKGNRDDNPATAINVRQGVVGGSVLKRIPGFTAAIVEAGDGVYREQTFASDFGRMETFLAAREAADDDTLDKLINELLDDQATNRVAAQFSLVATHDHSRALVDYLPGDTVPMQMPPNLPKEERRVQQVSYVNSYPTEYVVVGSRVFMGEEAGGWELVRRLWRRFLRRDKDTISHPFMGGGGAGAPTVVIAPENASDLSKSKADFICTGVDDHLVIQDAINSLITLYGARILLAEGQFNGAFAGSPNVITTTNPITIEGMGTEGTVFNVTDSFGGTPQDRAVFRLGGPDSYIKGLTIQGGDGSSGATDGIYLDGANSHVRDVGLFTDGVGVIVVDGFCSVESSQFGNNGNGVEAFADHSKIIGNHFNTGGRGVVLSNSTTGFMVVSDNTFSHVSGSAIASDVFDGIHHSVISGNVMDRVGGHGIILNDSSNNIIQGNLVIEVGATNNTQDGIILTGDSNNNLIKGNKVISRTASPRTRYGINVADAACNGNALIHNDLRPSSDFGTGDLNDDGTDTIFHGNVGDGGVGGGDPSASQSSKVVFSQAGVLSVGSGTFKLPFTLDAEIISVLLAVAVSPTGANLIADVNKNGTTIFTTQANRPTVPDGDANGVGAEAVPDVTTISEGDYLTVDIDQVGSTVAGEDLTVAVEWRPA